MLITGLVSSGIIQYLALVYFKGRPVPLNMDQLDHVVRLSSMAFEEEQARSERPLRPNTILTVANCLASDPDPGSTSGEGPSSISQDFTEIYRLLPHLGGLVGQSIEEITFVSCPAKGVILPTN